MPPTAGAQGARRAGAGHAHRVQASGIGLPHRAVTRATGSSAAADGKASWRRRQARRPIIGPRARAVHCAASTGTRLPNRHRLEQAQCRRHKTLQHRAHGREGSGHGGWHAGWRHARIFNRATVHHAHCLDVPPAPPCRGAIAQPAGAHRTVRAARRPGHSEQARSLVLFAHGSGSSRLSSRNRWVAEVLQQHRLATLLFDLLDDDEAADRRKVFDIALLSQRVEAGPGLGLEAGCAGGHAHRAVRCQHRRRRGAVRRSGAAGQRGGGGVAWRPARSRRRAACRRCSAPTLLIVGGADREVLDLNRQALRELRCNKRLEIVPGATHLFEEPGTLSSVARTRCRLVRDPSRPRAPPRMSAHGRSKALIPERAARRAAQ